MIDRPTVTATMPRCYRPDPRHPERLTGAAGTPEADLTAAAIHGAFRAFVLDPHYPCVGAKSAVNAGSYRLGVYDELGTAGAAASLAGDLAAFATEPETEAPFATFVAVFEGPQGLTPQAFEERLWRQLQLLHDRDRESWDPSVSADPGAPHFAFSFGGLAFFVVGLHPDSERLSRRFPWPTLVFNPHGQFERLRAEQKWERMQQVIRDRDEKLQGDVNPVLRDFGEESAARQYSGRAVEAGWEAPFAPHDPPEESK